MIKIEDALGRILYYLVITLAILSWIDWLWIFGVEDSQYYTVWGLIYLLANGVIT